MGTRVGFARWPLLESILQSQSQGSSCDWQQCRAPRAGGLSCSSVLWKTQPCTRDAQYHLPIPRAKGWVKFEQQPSVWSPSEHRAYHRWHQSWWSCISICRDKTLRVLEISECNVVSISVVRRRVWWQHTGSLQSDNPDGNSPCHLQTVWSYDYNPLYTRNATYFY